ncbi:hypothetical protein [Sutterella wadsworthensis]|uniref:hypothetical protein n=2 Tax=Sutterellaceae TaxID=995019 RepID=UPI00307A7C3F
MTNPQMLQPLHCQSIRSSALKSDKNVCTADKLGFVLDTSTHSLELSEAFTELLSGAAKHPIRTQNDLLEAAASELDRNLLDHALTAHDSPFEYVRFKTRNQVSWTRIDLQTRITPEGKTFVDGSVTWYDAGQIIHDLLPAASPSGQMLRSLQKLFLLSFEHPVFFATIRAETPVKSVRLVDYIAARLRELACCAEVLPGGHFFFEHQCDAEKSGADKDLLTALNTFLKEADPDASIEILESKRSAAASDNSRLSFWRTVADLLDDEVKAGHPEGEVTFSDLIILAEACLNDFKAFYLDLQPIISCSDGSYIGGEFLIRLDSDKINFGPDKSKIFWSAGNLPAALIRGRLQTASPILSTLLLRLNSCAPTPTSRNEFTRKRRPAMSELPPLNDLWMLILIAALVFIPIGMRLKAIAARIRRRAAWWCIRPTLRRSSSFEKFIRKNAQER